MEFRLTILDGHHCRKSHRFTKLLTINEINEEYDLTFNIKKTKSLSKQKILIISTTKLTVSRLKKLRNTTENTYVNETTKEITIGLIVTSRALRTQNT